MTPEKSETSLPELTDALVRRFLPTTLRGLHLDAEKQRVLRDKKDSYRRDYPTLYSAVTLLISERRRVTLESLMPFFSGAGFVLHKPHQAYTLVYDGQLPYLQVLMHPRTGNHGCLEQITIEALSPKPALILAGQLLEYLQKT